LASVTTAFVYDRTDQLVSAGGTAFGYDKYGNMTSDAESVSSATAMTYDLGDRLATIDGSASNDAKLTLDALGRFRTRELGPINSPTTIDTYSYAGPSETVLRIANSGGTTTDSIVSPSGDRLGVKQGTTLNWLLPDLHGNVAAAQDATEATVVNATRYDAYGETLATGSGGGTPVGAGYWKFQGRLDVSPSGLNTPLYDMSARFYSPGIGAFTQLDSVMGGAQNPLSMNRFLYALANPATMIVRSRTSEQRWERLPDPLPDNPNHCLTAEDAQPRTRMRHARALFASVGARHPNRSTGVLALFNDLCGDYT
jgi:RHS repeat-associated protein